MAPSNSTLMISTIAPTTHQNDTFTEVDLMMPSTITLCVLTMLLMLITIVMVFLYYFRIGNRYTLDTHTSLVLLFLGGLLATITAVSSAREQDVVLVYRLYTTCMACLVGLFFTCVGSFLFFDSGRYFSGEELARYNTIGHRHGNLGIVIWIVTVPLVILEVLIVIGAVREHTSCFYVAARVTTTVEKLLQAGIYYFSIRHRFPKIHCIAAAQWYFQILSLYNFTLWVDSIITTNDDDGFLKEQYGAGFSILKAGYNALIIDYRMLCALLFLEHGFEMGSARTAVHKKERKSESNSTSVEVASLDQSHGLPEKGATISMPLSVEHRVSHYSGLGYILGIFVILLQALNGLQYLNFAGPAANISGISADIIVIVLGTLFLRINSLDADLSGHWRESDSKGVDAMVGIMGGVGFTFWIIKAFMSSVLAAYYQQDMRHQYLLWTSVKNCVRAAGVIFQLYLFTRTSPEVCTRRRNRRILLNHFLVPALMLCLLAVFVTAVVDQYHGHVEVLLHHSRMDGAVRFLLEAGDPTHLAFCLHMFLHFLIVRYRMVNIKVRVTYLMEETSVIEPEDYDVIVEGRRSARRELRTPLLGDQAEPSAPHAEKH